MSGPPEGAPQEPGGAPGPSPGVAGGGRPPEAGPQPAPAPAAGAPSPVPAPGPSEVALPAPNSEPAAAAPPATAPGPSGAAPDAVDAPGPSGAAPAAPAPDAVDAGSDPTGAGSPPHGPGEDRPPRRSGLDAIVSTFLQGAYSPLLLVVSALAGFVALAATPREEDPQIVVPAAHVLVDMPGATVDEVERQVATRLEALIAQIEGIEHVYSRSGPGQAVVTARFVVGADREDARVRLHDKIAANTDALPPGVTGWVVEPAEIDDVPILQLALWSATEDDAALRRMAEELALRLQAVADTGPVTVHGGRPREVTVHLDPARMAARGVGVLDLRRAVERASAAQAAGALVEGDAAARLRAGAFLDSAEALADLVVATHDGRPVTLREVADVAAGPAEAASLTRLAFGPRAFAAGDPALGGGPARAPPPEVAPGADFPCVTVAVAKRRGTNAVHVSAAAQEAARAFARDVLPPEVHLRVTRDTGQTADHKVDELLEALWVAIVIVVAVLAWSLGWREGLIIALAVPVTFSLTLLVNLLLGYSINRVTLFALILALGLVVDDPIVDVENIHRHLAGLRGADRGARLRAIVRAVGEVRPPIILATAAVIVSFVPLFFITGMMGPYMAPMALNVPVAMLMSLVVAFTVTPWLAAKLLRPGAHDAPAPTLEATWLYRAYARVLGALLRRPAARRGLFAGVGALLALSGALVVTGRVPLKMLPYDDKNELQVVLDLPEGTPLERTEAVAAEVGLLLARVPEATDVTWWAGAPSPIDFNGLVRQYDQRRAPHLADVRLNLIDKKARATKSHTLGLRVRPEVEAIARARGARATIVETPPGPPVVSTLVAEVRGGPFHDHAALVAGARRVRAHLAAIPGVVDLDDSGVAPQTEVRVRLDRAKAALHGVDEAAATATLALAQGAAPLGALRLGHEVEPVRIVARLPRALRARAADVLRLDVATSGLDPAPAEGRATISLRELARVEAAPIEQPAYHKDLRRVAYVFAETAGTTPAEAVLAAQAAVARDPALAGLEVAWAGEGEWKITLEVFRDLGLAFAAAVLGIYVLLVHQTRSGTLPLVLLLAIPLTAIGIVPGFWLLDLLVADVVGGHRDPVYFTATAMIGVIALAGIATRNAILLVEFVQEARARGTPLERALVEAGALRTRPILLTAGTALLAAWPITLDPIFSGLAWALIFGLVVSTAFTLVVVPTVYALVAGDEAEGPAGLGQG